MDMTLSQFADRIGGVLIGHHADTPVTGVAGLDSVADGEVTFVMDDSYLARAEESPAVAIIAPERIRSVVKPLIIVPDPRAAFARGLALFDWRRTPLPGIDLSARIAKTAAIHARAHIGPFVSVGEDAVIGDGCIIHAHAVIGDDVEIGAGTVIYPQVTIYPKCTIGARVVLHAGAVIGADGHGYQPGPNGWEHIPHLGTVLIEDDVEIGALTTVDRATTGVTRIGRGSKIDNLVMVAHNVDIGRDCMIVAQVGIAGSTVVEDGVIIAGQAGVVDHVRIGAQTRLAACAVVTKDTPAGVMLSGNPAQPHSAQLRQDAAVRRLPALLATVRQLEKQVAELQKRLGDQGE